MFKVCVQTLLCGNRYVGAYKQFDQRDEAERCLSRLTKIGVSAFIAPKGPYQTLSPLEQLCQT